MQSYSQFLNTYIYCIEKLKVNHNPIPPVPIINKKAVLLYKKEEQLK